MSQEDSSNSPLHISDWPKYVSLILLVLTLAVGMSIWATNSHAEIKDWTAGQDFVTKQELKEVIKEQYVPLYEFTKVQESLKNLKEDTVKIEKKLDKVLEKLGKRR